MVRRLMVVVALLTALAAQATLAGPQADAVTTGFALYLPVPWGAVVNAGAPHPETGNTIGTPCSATVVCSSVDFADPTGAALPVRAAAAGVVHLHSLQGFANCWASVDHGNGWATRYWHLTKVDPHLDGHTVTAGQLLGYDGQPVTDPAGHAIPGGTTCGTGPAGYRHLTFSLFKSGAPVAIGGTSIGGYTTHSTGAAFCGSWTRNSTGATVVLGCTTAPSLANKVLRPPPTTRKFTPFSADFDADGKADLGLRNAVTGVLAIRYGPTYAKTTTYTWAPGTKYQVVAGDLDADHFADLVLRNTETGVIFVKHGPQFADQDSFTWAIGTKYQLASTDFDGDGRADLALRNVDTGAWSIKHGPRFRDQIGYVWAIGTKYQALAADFDGDHRGDLVLRNADTGSVFIRRGPGFATQTRFDWTAGTEFQPFAADLNADGKADLGLRNADTGLITMTHGTAFTDRTTFAWSAG